jgi:CRP-like cAMP-binding protein
MSKSVPVNNSYDASVATEFFRSVGKPHEIEKGRKIFAESEKGIPLLLMPNLMYLLLEGEVSVLVNDKPIATVQQGEIFGEMAAINQAPRSATAVAKTPCRVIALNDRQFQAALSKKPEFALMLMSVMIGRLRETIGRLNGVSMEAEWREATVLDKDLLAEIERRLGAAARFRYGKGKIIMREGHLAVALYIVLEGRIAIHVGSTLVEKAGPGSAIGEMGLVDRKPRLATATAETDCTLLAISRLDFLKLVKKNPRFGVSLLSTVSERARSMAERCKP